MYIYKCININIMVFGAKPIVGYFVLRILVIIKYKNCQKRKSLTKRMKHVLDPIYPNLESEWCSSFTIRQRRPNLK